MSVDLSSLIERVEKCSGPDRKLDAAIRDALYPPHERGAWLPYTSSLDCALALVEEKLPGWTWEIGISPAADHLGEADKFVAHLRTPRGVLIGGAHGFMESGLSAPLALILALLRALSNGSKEGA